MSELKELEVAYNFSDPLNSNITLGLQFYKKKPKQTVADKLSALNNRLDDLDDDDHGDFKDG